MDDIKLNDFVKDSFDPYKCFELATQYYINRQFSTAFTFFMLCSEYTGDKKLISESLLTCYKICTYQNFTEQDKSQKQYKLIKSAMTCGVDFPELYYVKTKYHYELGEWEEAYITAITAIKLLPDLKPSCRNSFFEYSENKLLYITGDCALKINLFAEATEIFRKLNDVNMFKKTLYHPECPYLPDKKYSQAYQDVFVEKLYDNKKHGTFLEIGANHYKYNNNTYLLEKEYNWSGISIEIDDNYEHDFKTHRKSKFICSDATQIDYKELLSNMPKTIDYLQLDCDPPSITFDILLKIPFDEYKFGVITYEHDYYADMKQIYRDMSRAYLKSKGYVLIVGNITPDIGEQYPFEDWWIHPDCFEYYHLFKYQNDTKPIFAYRYINYLTKMKKELAIQQKYHTIDDNILTHVNYHGKQSAKFKLYKDCVISACYRRGFRWEEHQHDIIDKFLDSNSVVIEAGSHIGTETVKLSKVCKHVYAFEPMPMSYDILCQNLELNDCNNVTIFKKGLSDKPGRTKVSCIYNDNSGGSQLHGGEDASNFNEVIEIELVTIDDLCLDQLDYIKMDVESYEHLVIEGGINTIKKHRPIIILEYWKHNKTPIQDKFKMLIDLGYRYEHSHFDDYLFFPY